MCGNRADHMGRPINIQWFESAARYKNKKKIILLHSFPCACTLMHIHTQRVRKEGGGEDERQHTNTQLFEVFHWNVI